METNETTHCCRCGQTVGAHHPVIAGEANTRRLLVDEHRWPDGALCSGSGIEIATVCPTCTRSDRRDKNGACLDCDYLRLCTHREAEGQCDRCAAERDRDRKAADYDRLAAEVERMRAGLSEAAGRAEEIRNAAPVDADDLDGMLTALADEAREVAAGDKPHLLHLADDEIKALRKQLAELERERADERDEARSQTAMLREIVQAFWQFAGVADAAEGEPWKVNETNGRLWQMRHDLTAAEARAEALATALSCPCDDIYGGVHRCVRCDSEVVADETLAATPPACRVCDRCGSCIEGDCGDDCCDGRCGVTPPADLTQSPAYRAGVEAAAKVCKKRGERHAIDALHARLLVDEERAEHAEAEADECAASIRALLDTKEVRDGE